MGLSVYQRPDTNALDVADAVRKKMEELKTRFPDGLAYDIGYDITPFIRESVQDVVTTMLEAVALVGLVVLIFLQDWKAMILPMIDVPVSIIGTFAVMAAMGFSLNNISLFGLVLTIGIVVDDAIVVLENIERMLARGHDVAHGHHQGHGGSDRTDHRGGPGAVRGFRALRVSQRHHRPVFPAVRLDDLRLDGHFGHQCDHHDAVAGRADLQDRGERSDGLTSSSREALPWWIFGAAGGLLTLLAGAGFAAPAISACPAGGAVLRSWRRSCFLPGVVAGGASVGWSSGRVNRVLGWLFRDSTASSTGCPRAMPLPWADCCASASSSCWSTAVCWH